MIAPPRVVVVGAGVAGLAAARAVRARAPEVEVLVLEAAGRVGGLVETTVTPEGFVIEEGADSLVTTKPRGVAAVHAAGLADAIVETGARRSYIARGDGLVPIPPVLGGLAPAGLLAFLESPLLSMGGKLRAALEPLRPAAGGQADESVAAFANRRFGPELAHALIDPLIGGIYGAATGRLSAEACVPQLREFERRDGSVVLGVQRAIRARRRRARAGEVVWPPVVSLRRGMGSLPDAMARDVAVTTGIAVERVVPLAGGFRLETTGGTLTCDGVVLAMPAWSLPPLLEGWAADLAGALAGIPYKTIDCVTFAWRRRDVPHALDGTGWVRATDDPRPTVACTWASQKWPDRAPPGFVLMRSMVALPESDEADLVAAAREDLRDLLGVRAQPAFVRVRRRARATPIYEVGHHARVARIAELTRPLGPCALAGNAYRGIGIPDCIASGEDAAATVVAALAGC